MRFLNHVARNGMRLSVSFVQKLSDRHVRRYAGTKDRPGQSSGRDKD